MAAVIVVAFSMSGPPRLMPSYNVIAGSVDMQREARLILLDLQREKTFLPWRAVGVLIVVFRYQQG